ncbi:hypothetical protein PUR59_00570 [Streptomyces sp. SP18ES09]|uniref:hypothetical protein n=1 Tax=Streptomyces sp. SP18ES09 TaxID=3002532 RepID=UPI002E7855FB|nr:hypothetical protein [Streptomyces sp. SP18ES09]MEE1813545.1 hypothetical protein [Streptomyces sp. SP18ES09]
MADVFLYYGGVAPVGTLDPEWALEFARQAAGQVGLRIADGAESTIRYASDGSGRYRVETPAAYVP